MKMKMMLKQADSKLSKQPAQKITFEHYAPTAKSVCLAGTFNDWKAQAYPLKKDKEGKWKTALSLAPGRYEYLYVVDGVWECDPSPKECVPNPFGSWNCVVNV